MKKLLAITIAIILMMPQPVYAMRPVAEAIAQREQMEEYLRFGTSLELALSSENAERDFTRVLGNALMAAKSAEERATIAVILNDVIGFFSGAEKDKVLNLIYQIFTQGSPFDAPARAKRENVAKREIGIFSAAVTVNLDFSAGIVGFPLEKRYRQNAGGEGVNVARALSKWGVAVPTFGFVGKDDNIGPVLRRLLEEDGVSTDFLTEADGQSSLCIFTEGSGIKVGNLNSGPKVTAGQREEFQRRVFNNVKKDDILVVAGSALSGFSEDSFAQLIAEAKARGVKTFFNSKIRPLFARCIEEAPYLVSFNVNEMADYFKVDPRVLAGDPQAVNTLGQQLIAKGIEVVVVTLGARGAVMLTKNGTWLAQPPQVEVESAIGTGDALLAGIVYRLAQGSNLTDAFRFGVAAGTATVQRPGVDLAELEDVMRIYENVTVKTLERPCTFKASEHKRALIINNMGNGNVIMTLPILAALEDKLPQLEYFCLDQPLMRADWILNAAGISGLRGFVPPLWRRFLPKDKDKILQYLLDNGITWIINLRLQSPGHDEDYLAFKRLAREHGIECWDLHDFGISSYPFPFTFKVQQLSKLHGIVLDVDYTWLRDTFAPTTAQQHGKTLNVYLGASEPKKRWQPSSWIRYIETQLSQQADYDVCLMSGITQEERAYAEEIFEGISPKYRSRVSLYTSNGSMYETMLQLSRASIIITHDTFAAHFAAACGIKCIIIFLATDARVWRPISRAPYQPVQSKLSLACKHMKPDGTCTKYYADCDAPCRFGVIPEDILPIRSRRNPRVLLALGAAA